MAKMIFLEGLDDELIQINRSYSLSVLRLGQRQPGKWAISAFYDMKRVSWLAPEFDTREAALKHMQDMAELLTEEQCSKPKPN